MNKGVSLGDFEAPACTAAARAVTCRDAYGGTIAELCCRRDGAGDVA